ncbi:DEAD/DEAH box helicase [Nocardia donostiensis]|uniref:DEAD/DEAH box helicase n=1 Tax=Nocardia donostiensis TaxID=1538463 RepID=UPI0009DAABE6|nr:DEAD/DEAH box helicase [Nocardia donostiensis]
MSSSAAAAQSFAELGVHPKLTKTLAAGGITAPFLIQAATLPDTLAGRDVLGRGKTGSGKTLAFSLPMVQSLTGVERVPGRPTGLILAPTRELATQIAATLTPLAEVSGLRVVTVFGGVPVQRQARALGSGADILVACPGRLEDLMRQRIVSLDAVRIAVLDEADHMADLGFLAAVTRILAATPSGGQRLLFSATLDNGVDKLVKRFLNNPLSHSVQEAETPVPAMTHQVFEVASTEAKREMVRVLASGSGRRILFMRTKHHAARLAKQLTGAGVTATSLHGNLSQNARDRNLAAFTTGTARVLVATDIAARGVHVDDVELVVHVDPPAEHKAYLHRSGRTARAGSSGDVVTLVLPEQRKDVAVLLRKAGLDVQPQPVTPRSAAVIALAGRPAQSAAAAASSDPGASSSPARQAPSQSAPARTKQARVGSGRGKPASRHTNGSGSDLGRAASRSQPKRAPRRGTADQLASSHEQSEHNARRGTRSGRDVAPTQPERPQRRKSGEQRRNIGDDRTPAQPNAHRTHRSSKGAEASRSAAPAPRNSRSGAQMSHSGASTHLGQRSGTRRATRPAG